MYNVSWYVSKCDSCHLRIDDRQLDGNNTDAFEGCDSNFARSSQLAQHLLMHTEATEFQCPTCGKLFSHAWNLTRHAKSHSGKPNQYLCHLCGRSYTQKGTLIDHMDVHYGRKHSCDRCGKKFMKGSYLRQHMRLAHNQTVFGPAATDESDG